MNNKPYLSKQINDLTDDWLTPCDYLPYINALLGDIDLDPCSTYSANVEFLRAKKIYTPKEDGLNIDDPNGKDDVFVESNELHLLKDRPVKILLRSIDVLHNFYVPQFRSKMDAVPGTITFYWFEPNKNGEYEVLCAEYCGVAHYAMRGKVVVENEDSYNKWLTEQETFSSFTAKNRNNELNEKKLVKISNLSSKENSVLRKQNVR